MENPETGAAKEYIAPVLPCLKLADSLKFYRALGFEVTHEQEKPYVWATVRRGPVEIHLHRVKVEPEKSFSMSLIVVDDVEVVYRTFIEGLRAAYGRPPVAGLPRITRLRKGQTRFQATDPAGSALIFLNRYVPRGEYDWDAAEYAAMSPMATALDTAVWLRDLKGHDDVAAARVLDKALAKNEPSPPIDLARVLAARAELAIALGDKARADDLRAQLLQITLSEEEREQYRDELEAADALERMLAGA